VRLRANSNPTRHPREKQVAGHRIGPELDTDGTLWNYSLAKSGSGWIGIKSSASLPAEGTRVTPAEAGLMPKLEASGDAVIVTAAGARGYRFVGIELRPTPGVFLFNLVLLGTNSETPLDQLPRNIIFDRCYLHGDPQAGTRRGDRAERGPAGGDRFVSGGLQGSRGGHAGGGGVGSRGRSRL
jgi:hypothetical protein